MSGFWCYLVHLYVASPVIMDEAALYGLGGIRWTGDFIRPTEKKISLLAKGFFYVGTRKYFVSKSYNCIVSYNFQISIR